MQQKKCGFCQVYCGNKTCKSKVVQNDNGIIDLSVQDQNQSQSGKFPDFHGHRLVSQKLLKPIMG